MKAIDRKQMIFDYQYSGALYDSTAQLAYKGKKVWMAQMDDAREAVYQHIEKTLLGLFKNQQEYDESFEKTAHTACDIFNCAGRIYNPEHPDEYTFGNAQKLINMTAKNMYAVTYEREELRRYFQWCHCPMDSIMLGKVWNECADIQNHCSELGDRYSFLKSWGNENWNDRSRYTVFQAAVRKLCKQMSPENGEPLIPIELDYYLWNER